MVYCLCCEWLQLAALSPFPLHHLEHAQAIRGARLRDVHVALRFLVVQGKGLKASMVITVCWLITHD